MAGRSGASAGAFRVVVVGVALGAVLAGCGGTRAPVGTATPATPGVATPPGPTPVPAVLTPVPGTGALADACPTLEEAKAAVPLVTSGPDVNTEVFKTMVLQCNYWLDELDVSGRPAGIGILVFDATAEGPPLWDSVRTDPGFPDPAEIPGLAEVAFATGTPGHNDIWVVQGGYGFHMSHLRQGGIPLDQMVTLARAMVEGLGS